MTNDEEKYRRVLSVMVEWKDLKGGVTSVTPDSIRSLGLAESDGRLQYIAPQATKEIYYSIFIHKMLEEGERTGWDKYRLIEMIQWMLFTPSASGWLAGIDLALADDAD